MNEPTTSCLGGDDLLGLKITENDANVTVGDTVVGRESGSFLGKVSIISFFSQGERIFVAMLLENLKADQALGLMNLFCIYKYLITEIEFS